jgi:hypothetical protein
MNREAPVKNLQINIVDFIQHPALLNDRTLSDAQLVCLKSTYGLPLNECEQKIYFQGTGRLTYDAKQLDEVTFIIGRRGGKTGKIAAPIVCYEAFRDHGLPPGEDAYVMLLAPTLKQARIAFRYIRKYLRNSPILSKRIVRITKDEITLDNNIVIGCHACTQDGVRGRTVVAIVCDEIGHWPFDEDSANPADEVLAALRPSMATVRNAKLIKISTPYIKSGVLWEEFQTRSELDYPVWQLTTFKMNPTVTPQMVDSERQRSEENYRREYLAEFTDSISGWVPAEILDPCIARGRQQLPRQEGLNYIAAIDPATRGHNFALVILHQVPDGTVVVDLVRIWTGSTKIPLPFEGVLNEIKMILDSYGVSSAIGDQFHCDAIQQYLQKIGVWYEVHVFGPQTRAQIFSGLKHLMVQGKIEILDDKLLLQQLRNLTEERSERGQIDIRPSTGKDDQAVALALAASQVTKYRPPDVFDSVRVNRSFLGRAFTLDPENCPYAAGCQNHPRCVDESGCLGFVKTICDGAFCQT